MLKNKTVLITGASSGIGKACAVKFAEQETKLVIAARNLKKLELLKAELLEENSGLQIHCIKLDVTCVDEVNNTLSTLPEDFKNIDILINNAGLAQGIDKIHEANTDDWDRMIDTNIKGLLYVSRIVSETMMARDSGHIINIGSISSHQVYPGGNVYCATKFAVKALTEAMQMDFHDSNIRVSAVDPGMVETNYALTRFRGDSNQADQVYAGMTPLSADDVAETVVFCASRPAHVNISQVMVLPAAQTCAFMVKRES